MLQELASFDDIKHDQFIIDHILWNLEPKDLMEPRIAPASKGGKTRGTIKGYVFYIDVTGEKPGLYLLRHTAGDYAETACRIDSIPEEMLLKAIEENKDREYFKMYPINKAIRELLEKEMKG
ncbi:MAG TPA: hypothetical protein VK445_01985 [Dissulfurispiraceae bacterium]|nr:hypothetical protein [Dissulfurispiraceae bacterium]